MPNTTRGAAQININDRVTIDNLNDWDLHFHGIDSQRDMKIPASAHGWKQLTIIEVESQIKAGNKFFCGSDGNGNNAAVRICDDKQRAYLFGTEPDAPEPVQLTLDTVRELLGVSPIAAFTERLKQVVVTDAEKRMLMRLAVEAGLNDVVGGAGKKSAIERHTGFKFADKV